MVFLAKIVGLFTEAISELLSGQFKFQNGLKRLETWQSRMTGLALKQDRILK